MNDYLYADSACFTGHRRLSAEALPALRASLREAVISAWEKGFRSFLCGGALGFDTLAAETVLKLRDVCPGLRLVLVLPCADQTRYWRQKDQAVHARLMEDADEVITLRERYDPGCMENRNHYMVDHASLCICLLTRFSGGTLNTVRYAVRRGLPVWNLALPAETRENPRLKESVWDYMCTFPSASVNAATVTFRLIPPPKGAWRGTWKRSCGKRG